MHLNADVGLIQSKIRVPYPESKDLIKPLGKLALVGDRWSLEGHLQNSRMVDPSKELYIPTGICQ